MRPEEPRWRPNVSGPAPRPAARPAGAPPDPKGGPPRGPDHFVARRPVAGDVPHWLIAMSADRAAGRQHLPEEVHRRAREAEAAWIAGWLARLPATLTVPTGSDGSAARLGAWQTCVDALCAVAGVPIPRPHVVWQPAMGVHRGQYLFQVDGPLVQLRPTAAGSPQEWLATVAHETYHHAQHVLLVALYQGLPAWPAPFDMLAAYFRDARNVYRGEGPECPPAAHRQQALELGAWRFGRLVGERAAPGA